jgi:hypothetical protein
MESISYQLDAGDRIAGVSASWAAFAVSNDAPHLVDGVLGRPIWDFVSDLTTRHVYQELLRRVRNGNTITFSYRCDAPALRRFMRMTMAPRAENGVDFLSETVRTEPRAPLAALAAPAAAAASADALVRICSWCKRFAVASDWLEGELAIERLGLFAGDRLPKVTHAMCPDCTTRVMGELDAGDEATG